MKNNKGFTLIELIVIITMLAILVGVTVGGISMYISEAKENVDRNNASAMSKALASMISDADIYNIGSTAVHTSEEHTYTYNSKWFTLTWINEAPEIPVIDGDGVPDEISIFLNKIFTDGLPKSQTGKGFVLDFRFDENGFVATCNTLPDYLEGNEYYRTNKQRTLKVKKDGSTYWNKLYKPE